MSSSLQQLWRFVQGVHAYITASGNGFFDQSWFIFRRATFGYTYRLMGNFDYSLHCGELLK